jgi:hypothetical protein
MAKDAPATVESDFDPHAELRDYAAELFARRTANGIRGIQVEKVAIDCFEHAQIFLSVADRVASGEISSAPTPPNPLNEACAPNLKKTHPHNLVSQRFGNINRVKAIMDKLQQNPTLTELEDLEWKEQEIVLAKLIFPPCLERAGMLAAVAAN